MSRTPRRRYRHSLPFLLVLLAAACERSGAPPCGIGALAGYTFLLEQFNTPGRALDAAPDDVPGRLAVRLVAGPAYPAVTGRSGDSLVVGVEGALPQNVRPQFGVLVVDAQDRARGVVLYESEKIRGAPVLGTVTVGALTLPLVGLQTDPSTVETPGCPLFPDSITRT
ncbi:MAG TPA: hypothetical protein VNK43_11130 [Gemmatimonadales bacterium]|nr:hypothetical protein [Gemmatimonadales bacterium]